MLPRITSLDCPQREDAHAVAATKAVLGIGEFELFRLAHRWFLGSEADEKALERVFMAFLFGGAAPMWVRQYCRAVRDAAAEDALDPRRFGLERLPRRITPPGPLYLAIMWSAGLAICIAFSLTG